VYAARRAGLAYAKVADGVVALALDAAREAVTEAHGAPPGLRVSVLGLGRLGQRDLTATSDLDLVILYDAPDFEARSDGPRPLDVVTWAQRLAQRLVTALTVPTRRGLLYEVDLRLRPSGRSGPMAVRLQSFSSYQREEAELWEHMALTKARLVAGDAVLGAEAMALVRAVLARPREPARVNREVRAMRDTIAAAKGDTQQWNLKLARGGLTDLDFIAEALVLAHAARAPALVTPDTEDILRVAEAEGLLTPEQAATLIEAHALFNDVTHWQRLAVEGDFDPAAAPPAVRRLIAGAVNTPDLSVLAALLAERRAAVRAIYETALR
jgi:glutamate-ammonia-ligase adenylyltransferase